MIGLAGLVGLILAAVLLTLILVPLCRGIGWLIGHIFAFIGGELRDCLRVVGAIVTAVVFSLLVVANVLIFRWSASAHFGRAFSAELAAGGASIYRIFIGHPARLLGLNSLVDGIENRVPQAVAAAPTRDKPSKRTGQFESYKIIGSLPGGGSGGKLYIAEPDDIKLAAFARNGQHDVEQVVLKSFSLRDGSSLPQIVRESRSLDAAKKLGLVLDHELTSERFFYVMRYVPGESLGLVTQHLHAASPAGGLSNAHLDSVMGYLEHLLATLRRYHEGGLWHKDVKPDNIIIHGDSAHLVDFGLITPLRSAMTLTTHGTEYFRDPELVRMALKGVKVHEIDGARFDVYAAGAVLFSVIENSFPAHGGLSQVSKRCPNALRWIVRRAMTDYDKRYATANAMLADLNYLRAAPDPFEVKPAELPSVVVGDDAPLEPVVEVQEDEFDFASPRADERVASPSAKSVRAAARAEHRARAAVAIPASARLKPKLRVTGWWSGKYELEGAPKPREDKGGSAVFIAGLGEGGKPFATVHRAGSPMPRAVVEPSVRRPAAEQLEAARSRVQERRDRARGRMKTHRRGPSGRTHASGVNAGVAISLFLFLAVCVGLAGLLVSGASRRSGAVQTSVTIGLDEPAAASGIVMVGPDGPVQVGATASAVSDSGEMPAESAIQAVPSKLDGRVLVVSDLALPGDEQVISMLQSGLAAMQQAGLEVLGTFDTLALDAAAQEAVNELIAEVRRERDLRPLESEGVREAITVWLATQEEADFLIWIEPTAKGEWPAAFWFGSPEAIAETPEGFLPTMQRLLIPQG
ncbi:hypothetical protein MNBD_PLANCTO03-565 [hydrothermal vent metagenome]|uniref:Protein kinase domain-containing protein n=1 Tax=hydrothermal vent metagenome TaxID=652676 RepID=A0A3B1E5I3_9ZZZZ